MEKRAVFAITCGFDLSEDGKPVISRVDRDRIKKLIELYQPGDKIYVAGDVPYGPEPGSPRLGVLASQYLMHQLRDFNTNPNIHGVLIAGLNALSESEKLCWEAEKDGYKSILVVSSDFYWSAYRRVWKACAKRHGLKIAIVEVSHVHLASQEVIDFYLGFQAQTISRLAASSRLGHFVARLAADFVTRGRANGFPCDGYRSLKPAKK